MNTYNYLPSAGELVADVALKAGAAELDRATPCSEFELGKLVNHFAGTTAALTRAGRRIALDPDDPYGSKQDITTEDWSELLAANVTALADAWTDPSAWEGTVDLGNGPMPAETIGDMVLAELLLHGWDLSKSIGLTLAVPPDLGDELAKVVEPTSEMGRQYGTYGPLVELPPGAPGFDRALAMSGRDPAWQG